MLGIAEVTLPIEFKLKNIEQTERAKQEMVLVSRIKEKKTSYLNFIIIILKITIPFVE